MTAESQANSEARRAIEAIVMVAEEPADPRLLAQLLECAPAEVDAICAELAEEYRASDRGFELVKVAGGWRYQSRAELAPYVERFVLSGQSARLSAAALETLAIIAYKQPLSRAQVSAIRGVNVDAVIRTLQQRGYITELARDTGPGQAVLFGTTSLFLERLGLNSLDELPPLGDFVPGPEVMEALEAGLRIDDTGSEPVIDLRDGGSAPTSSPSPARLDALEVLADDPD
jgi:segregation and condensation protein B